MSTCLILFTSSILTCVVFCTQNENILGQKYLSVSDVFHVFNDIFSFVFILLSTQ